MSTTGTTADTKRIPPNVAAWMLNKLRTNRCELRRIADEREKDNQLYQAYQLRFIADCLANVERRFEEYNPQAVDYLAQLAKRQVE